MIEQCRDMLKEFRPQPKPVPARIIIEQLPNGMFQCTHNLASIPFLIGVLSSVINTNAAQLAQQQSMIIGGNGKPLASNPPEPPTEIPITNGDGTNP